MKPIIAITTGDTNGIGYEVIIKALLEAHMFELFKPVIYGNAAVAKHHIQTLGEYWRNINWNTIESPEQAKDGRLNLIVSYPDSVPVTLGVPSEEANKAAKASLDRACKDLKEGKVHALVTAPLNKEALQGIQFGENPFLGDLRRDLRDRHMVAHQCHTQVTRTKHHQRTFAFRPFALRH